MIRMVCDLNWGWTRDVEDVDRTIDVDRSTDVDWNMIVVRDSDVVLNAMDSGRLASK